MEFGAWPLPASCSCPAADMSNLTCLDDCVGPGISGVDGASGVTGLAGIRTAGPFLDYGGGGVYPLVCPIVRFFPLASPEIRFR